MKLYTIIPTILFVSFNFLGAVTENFNNTQKIVKDRKISKQLNRVKKLANDITINTGSFGFYSSDFKGFNDKELVDAENGEEIQEDFKLFGEPQSIGLKLGCNGITYDGKIEQTAISYIELLRDTFVEYTEPYVCKSGDIPLLEKYAFMYAMPICTMEVASILSTGTDTNGNMISGESISSLSAECSSRILKDSDVKGGARANSGKLIDGEGGTQVGLGGSFAYMKCMYENLGEIGLAKYLDSCLDENRNDFIQFVMEMSKINFSLDLSIDKLRVEQCEKIMDNDGNTLDINLGVLDLFGSDKSKDVASSAPDKYKNINGLLLNMTKKTVSLQDDTLHTEIRKKFNFPLDTPKKSKPIIKDIIMKKWLDKLSNIKDELNKQNPKNANKCMIEMGLQLSDLYSTILSSYNMGINKYIYTLDDEIYFSKKYGRKLMSNKLPVSCNVVSYKYKKILLKLYEAIREDIIDDYFNKAEDIIENINEIKNDSTNTRHDLLSEKYFSNASTGKLNLEIEKFNMRRIKHRSDYLLKSKIIKFIYTKDKENGGR